MCNFSFLTFFRTFFSNRFNISGLKNKMSTGMTPVDRGGGAMDPCAPRGCATLIKRMSTSLTLLYYNWTYFFFLFFFLP
jgi:hypothetical protein